MSNLDRALDREMLSMAALNLVRSVPLQVVALGYFVYLGITIDRPALSWFTAGGGCIIAAWRVLLYRKSVANKASFTPAFFSRIRLEIEANALVSGIFWSACTVGIYPLLKGVEQGIYVVIICGAVSTAAFFLSPVGRAFEILSSMLLGSLAIVSCTLGHDYYALVLLPVLFGVTTYKTAQLFRSTARMAIKHRIEAENANHNLLSAKQEADAANIAKSQFLATMSHEIRTPMNGVLGSLDLLRHSELTLQQRRLVHTATSCGNTLMRILNDVLDHSKIEAGHLKLIPGPMALHQKIEGVIALLRTNAEAKKLQLRLVVGRDVPEVVVSDASRLQQVLLNLIGNAIKFTDLGNITLRVHLDSSQPDLEPDHRTDARVLFEVIDTGIGMSSDAVQKLFTPFFQVNHGKKNTGRGGTGLGLSISQRIVEAMGGQLRVDSEPNKGTRFSFVLTMPVEPSHMLGILDSSVGVLLDADKKLQGRVLLVEDNEVNRMIASSVLDALGIEVIEASDGNEAIEKFTHGGFDLILMDCQMPGLDGYEATDLIRKIEASRGLPRIPIVALTALAFDEDATRAREAGMDDYLSKPFTRVKLRDLLRKWI